MGTSSGAINPVAYEDFVLPTQYVDPNTMDEEGSYPTPSKKRQTKKLCKKKLDKNGH